MPCSSCLKSRKQEACVYEDEQLRGSTRPRRPSGEIYHVRSSPTLLQDAGLESTLMHIPGHSTGRSSTAALSTTRSLTSVDATGRASIPWRDIPSSLKNKTRQAEEQLLGNINTSAASPAPSYSIAGAPTPASEIETSVSQLGGTFHIHHPTEPTASNRDNHSRLPRFSQIYQPISSSGDGKQRLHGRKPEMSRNVSHKTRLFGQSHWFNTMAPLVRRP